MRPNRSTYSLDIEKSTVWNEENMRMKFSFYFNTFWLFEVLKKTMLVQNYSYGSKGFTLYEHGNPVQVHIVLQCKNDVPFSFLDVKN